MSWINAEHSLDQGNDFFTTLLEFDMIEMVLPVLDLVEEFVPLLGLEGKIATHEDIQHDSKRPDVNLGIVGSVVNNLGCHVEGGSSDCLELLGLCLLLRQTKIDQLDFVFLVEHDVLRFDVPVHDALGVDVSAGFQQLLHVGSSLLLCKRVVLRLL